ncbi:MAG: pyrimidine dimer DNA glycosylase/endonuclease V [Rhodanobacteraceae bacterium]
MRLWSLHPRYLDARGLVALWREALLAQAVLRGETRGYRHHPQLDRFRAQRDPAAAIASYLAQVQAEAARRGYGFDANRIGRHRQRVAMAVTRGQLDHEWRHLRAKLAVRDRDHLKLHAGTVRPRAHPCFRVIPGNIEAWERP